MVTTVVAPTIVADVIPVEVTNFCYTETILCFSPIAYWPLYELSGSIAEDLSGNDLDVNYTDVALGATGIGDGSTGAIFDGSASLVDIYSSDFNSLFDGQEGTISLWAKVSAIADWSDVNFKRLFELYVDANNWLILLRDSTQDGFIQIEYRAGGVTKVANCNTLGVLEWFNITGTWSKTSGEVKIYIDGVLQNTTSGVGTWAGNLSATGCTIGNQNTTPGSAIWKGDIAHVATWDTPLSATNIAYFGKLSSWIQDSPIWDTTPTWQDNFSSGAVPDSTYWTAVNNSPLCDEAYFLTNNVTVADGKMKITTQTETKGEKLHTSGYVHTLGKVQFTYGRFEISAKLPKSQGYWPAIWLLPAQTYFHEMWSPIEGYYGAWPISGEIDIIELIGNTPARSYPGIHTGNPHLSSPVPYYDLPSGDFSDGQHIFAFEWLPHAMKWYVDGILIRTHNTWFSSGGSSPAPYDKPFYLIFNTALGGVWPGATDGTTIYPQTFEIDYVKYYKYSGDVQILEPDTFYSDKVLALNPIAYWPLRENSNWNYIYDQTSNGLTSSTEAVTVGVTGIGDGRTAISFNGSTSSALIYSAAIPGLNSLFDGQSGSLLIWGKVSGASIWTGVTYERLVQIRVDDNNRILVLRYGGNNNQLIIEYHAGGTTEGIYPDLGGTLNWFNIIVTWDKVADEVKVYVNGTQSGLTQTGLGTWTGNLDNWTCCIGSSTYTPNDVWSGSLAHVAIWDVALTQTQINTISSV
jgi:beta-glucanase (GH16 family)